MDECDIQMTELLRDHRGRFKKKPKVEPKLRNSQGRFISANLFQKYKVGEVVEFIVDTQHKAPQTWELGRIFSIDYRDPDVPWYIESFSDNDTYWRSDHRVRKYTYEITETPARY